MPDWTYQTVFRPLLMAIGPRLGRSMALGFMGGLARIPGGRWVIAVMGHMQPDKRLAVERGRLKFPTRVGLGYAFDPQLAATPALAEFGLGFLEIGPITVQPPSEPGKVHVDKVNETILCDSPHASLVPVVARVRLGQDGPFSAPLFARIEPTSNDDIRAMFDALDDCVDGYVVPVAQLEAAIAVQAANNESEDELPVLFAAVDSGSWRDEANRRRCAEAASAAKIDGVVVAARIADDALQLGKAGFVASLETVRQARNELGPRLTVIGSVGVHSPADALDYLDAGADLVQIDSGLVFAGPGLAKRINEADLYRRLATGPTAPKTGERIGGLSWFWSLLMGLSMVVGGLLAMLIATTRVVLPYDEAMAGLTRAQLYSVNDRLLSFMTHDRVTLSGTMLAVGILYSVLAWWGIRRGVNWAYQSVVVSALAGFISFFSFLGFGYFDPFHAFVTALLFQFLLLTVHARTTPREITEPPDLFNDGRWRASQWGQLAFVVHGAILIVAGVVISIVGMTSVFVPEDFHFMQTTAAELLEAHPRLVPLVAHDRATFGGMLISCGTATMLPALWGFRRGQAWLWWALMIAGNTAYLATIVVHWTVGYDALMHLLPAYGGLVLLWIGGLASYRFVASRDVSLEQEWQRRIERMSA